MEPNRWNEDTRDKVLTHWGQTIGARCGSLDVEMLVPNECVIVSVGETKYTWSQQPDRLLSASCAVDNDFDAVIIVVADVVSRQPYASYFVPRIRCDSQDVVRDKECARLVERSELVLQFFGVADGALFAACSTPAKMTFVVRDLCPDAICESCHRGAQRCRCGKHNRRVFLEDRAERQVLKVLRDAEIALPPSSFGPPVVPRLGNLSAVHAERMSHSAEEAHRLISPSGSQDDVEDVSHCVVRERPKEVVHCGCALQ